MNRLAVSVSGDGQGPHQQVPAKSQRPICLPRSKGTNRALLHALEKSPPDNSFMIATTEEVSEFGSTKRTKPLVGVWPQDTAGSNGQSVERVSMGMGTADRLHFWSGLVARRAAGLRHVFRSRDDQEWLNRRRRRSANGHHESRGFEF
jgi:hypothetical protein